jgi:hypothetical protein
MAAELLATKWSRMVDMDLAEATVEALAANYDIKGGIGLGNAATMGRYCYFAMDNGGDADYTHPFDWKVSGDFTVVINATKVDTDAGVTLDVIVEGSVDGTNYTQMAPKTAILQVSDGTIDTVVKYAVYDFDTYGVLPYMRLNLTADTTADSTIMLAVFPH